MAHACKPIWNSTKGETELCVFYEYQATWGYAVI